AVRRGHIHRRLVGLQRNQRVLGVHAVADVDEHLDHRHVLEVADVGHFDVDQIAHRVVLVGSERQTVHGAARSVSSPYFAIASATTADSSTPSSASAFNAATATQWRSTSKKRRSLTR